MFTRITWIALLFSGVALFILSMAIEAAVLDAYLPSLAAALALAAALEIIKVTVVVLRRSAVERGQGVSASWLLRAMLIGFSALCSVMFLAESMHQPHREAVRAAELARLDDAYRQDMSRLDAELAAAGDARREVAREVDAKAFVTLDAHHRGLIADLEAQLDAEMDNVVAGVFEGPRYRAISRRIEAAKADYQTAVTAQREQSSALARIDDEQALAARQGRREALEHDHQTRREALLHADFSGDVRVANPTVHKFLEVLGAVMTPAPDAVVLVFAFALLLAMLMEVGIYVAFDTLALAWAPVFRAAHHADVAIETHRIEAEQALRTEDVDDGYLRKRTVARRHAAEARARGASHEVLAEV